MVQGRSMRIDTAEDAAAFAIILDSRFGVVAR
jgi:hypothetical protein